MPPIYVGPARVFQRSWLNCLKIPTSCSLRYHANGLEISIDGTSTTLPAEVQDTGTTSIPFTVLAGVLRTRHFGKNTVEIGCSLGKMRVDTTVFRNRGIS
jgi:hypothetical protein